MNQKIFTGILLVALVAGVGFLLLPKGTSVPKPPTSLQQSVEQSTGESSLYVEFTQAEYEKALTEDKVIFLDFYANWCPICRAEAPEIKAGFDSLTTDKVAGFRVNFNDDETDEDEKAFKAPMLEQYAKQSSVY